VRRLLLPRLRRRSDIPDGGNGSDWGSLPVGSALPDDLVAGVVAALAVALLAVLVFLFLPYVLFVLELLVLPFLLLYRVAFRRPWLVEARGSAGRRMRWKVVGWRESGEAVREIAEALERRKAVPAPLGATRV
jgi:hypothetical protein